jgi:hypothetical protein
VEHDLFGKPVSTFPDHALALWWSTILSENRVPLFRIMLWVARRTDETKKKSVGRVALPRPALLQEHFAEMRHGMGEHRGLIFFGHEIEDGVGEAFGDPRHQISDIRIFRALEMLLHDLVDVAVKAIRHERTRSVTLGLWHMWV